MCSLPDCLSLSYVIYQALLGTDRYFCVHICFESSESIEFLSAFTHTAAPLVWWTSQSVTWGKPYTKCARSAKHARPEVDVGTQKVSRGALAELGHDGFLKRLSHLHNGRVVVYVVNQISYGLLGAAAPNVLTPII